MRLKLTEKTAVRFFPKRFLPFVLCCVLVAGTFSGCENAQGLSDLTIVQGVGVDILDGKAQVSMQYLNLNKTGVADSLGENITAVVLGSEKTLNGAVGNACEKLSKSVFFGQNKLVIFGFDFAKSQLKSGADYLMRSVDSRPDVYVAVSDGDAADIVNSDESGSRIPMESVYELISSGEKKGCAPAVTVNELLNLYSFEQSDIYLPVLKYEDDNAVCGGTAVFSREKYAAALDTNETFGFLIIKNKIKGGTLYAESPQLGNCSAQIVKCSSSCKASYENGTVVFTCNVKADIMIDEIQNDSAACVNTQNITEIEELFGKVMENMCKNAFDKCRKAQSDVFCVSRYLAKNDAAAFEKLKGDWRNYYKSSLFNISVKSNLEFAKNNAHRD